MKHPVVETPTTIPVLNATGLWKEKELDVAPLGIAKHFAGVTMPSAGIEAAL